MKKNTTLSAYVKKRTGVPLGHNKSLVNMLSRSLGAGSFPLFWRYWNPIWSYYLSRFITRPVNKHLPMWFAIFTTFLVSGALHDVAVSVIKWKFVAFFTPWFGLMGILVITCQTLNVNYSSLPWAVRALINASFVLGSLFAMYALEATLFP